MTWRQTTYWKDSFTVFNHALKIAPVNFIAENNLGEAYLQIGRPDIAYGYFLRTTEETPRFGLGHYNLGVVLIGQKRRDEARKEFQLAIQHAMEISDASAAFHNLGIIMLEDNQSADAINMFSEALQLSPDKQSSYLGKGIAEFRLNNFRAAEADFVAGACKYASPKLFSAMKLTGAIFSA